MLEKNKDAQSQALLDLQQELKSLKALLLSRSGPPVSSLYPSSPSSISGLGAGAPPPLPRPSIPSWQLASPTTAPAPSTTPALSNLTPEPGKVDKGKGRDVEVDPLASSGVLVSQGESENEDSGITV